MQEESVGEVPAVTQLVQYGDADADKSLFAMLRLAPGKYKYVK